MQHVHQSLKINAIYDSVKVIDPLCVLSVYFEMSSKDAAVGGQIIVSRNICHRPLP